MTIEEEIKQPRFESEYQKLVINLHYTANWLGALHSKIFRSYKISAQQFNVLRILKGQIPNPSNLILIRERMLDKESNASRLIDKLENSGFIKRVQCPDDRRKVEITITDIGQELLNLINPEVDKIESKMTGLNEKEAKTLNHLLDKLRNR